MSASGPDTGNARSLPDIHFHSGFSVAFYPAGATFGPRTLRDYEFVWLMEGDAEYRHNSMAVPAPEGSVVLCRPPATDFFRWDTSRRTRHAYFHFALSGPLPASWPPISEWPLLRSPSGSDDLMHSLFRHLLNGNGRFEEIQCRLLTLSLLSAFITGQNTGETINAPALPPAVEIALDYVTRRLDENPATHLPLAELARVACVTPEHLCRLFKQTTQHSPIETVRRARLERAVLLLARTNFSIAEIATLCGFESPFHFSRLVSQMYGVSPRTLRQELHAGTRPLTTSLTALRAGRYNQPE